MLARIAVIAATTLIGLLLGDTIGWMFGSGSRFGGTSPREIWPGWHVLGLVLGLGVGAYMAFANAGRHMQIEAESAGEDRADAEAT